MRNGKVLFTLIRRYVLFQLSCCFQCFEQVDKQTIIEVSGFMRYSRLLVFALTLISLGCSTPPQYGMVDWSVINGSGSILTLAVYDEVCKRAYSRVRLSRSGEVQMTSCANHNGKAQIRYRKTGYTRGDFPWSSTTLNPRQALVVRQ